MDKTKFKVYVQSLLLFNFISKLETGISTSKRLLDTELKIKLITSNRTQLLSSTIFKEPMQMF